MALILKNPDGTYASKCAICGKTLSHPIFATSRFITDRAHEFHRLSDAAMHWDCYVKWPEQKRLASLYFDMALSSRELSRGRDWKRLLFLPDAFAGYDFAMNEITMALRRSGTVIRIHRSRWQQWLSGGWRDDCKPELEREAIGSLLPQLRELQLPEPRSR